jgi:nifR3 family TIM-barrel protein
MTFWQKLKNEKKKNGGAEKGEGIFVLAPMADVTDPAFRKIIAKYGKPDVIWTEFVSADGLCLAPEEGRLKLMKAFEFAPEEHPIVAQIFGSNSDHIEAAARLVQDLGFDGVDINMGCPDRSVEKQLAGASMVKKPKMAADVIRAAKRGADKIPVSVKIRLGYNTDEMEGWVENLLAEKPAVITVHARTRKEMSKVPAKWNRIADAVAVRDRVQADLPEGERTLIFGNGDVMNLDEARARTMETGCDGVMIGRGIFGTPWLFNKEGFTPDLKQRLEILIEHTNLFAELCSYKNFATMKKHFKAYIEGFEGAKELRMELMETDSAGEVEEILMDFIRSLDK